MKPRISVITLGVDDLERALRFYRDGLGLQRGRLLRPAVRPQAGAAGAVIVKPARDTFRGGYAGYFQDPDGHLREVVWNPQMLPPDEA
jgi:catechol 2,3-dioxygenase-like lactoylglutathione lyase family enzyme